jgi:hypothetical protein
LFAKSETRTRTRTESSRVASYRLSSSETERDGAFDRSIDRSIEQSRFRALKKAIASREWVDYAAWIYDVADE